MPNKNNFLSFYDFCKDHGFNNLLNLWDYDLNDKSPKEVAFKTSNMFYFRCPREIHESSKVKLSVLSLAYEKHGDYKICSKCNSIGQFFVDGFGQDYLNKVWSDKNGIDPFDVRFNGEKYWFRCPDNPDHPEYQRVASSLKRSHDCPYCTGRKLCDTNNLASIHPILKELWSDKNEMSPESLRPYSKVKIWLKCGSGKHEDYQRTLHVNNWDNLKCPKCRVEEEISEEDKEVIKMIPSGRVKYSLKQWCIDNNRSDILDRWDYERNEYLPENFSYSSSKYAYFKCPDGIHESELRQLSRLITSDSFVCTQCLHGGYLVRDNLAGKTFGQLTVVSLDKERTLNKKGTYWICKCECGATTSVLSSHLKDGLTKTCGDLKRHQSGSNNPNWKGGRTSKLLCERTCKDYNDWRDACYAKCYYTCQCCGKSKGINKNAHHFYNFSEYPELQYDIENSICLCEECHHIRFKGSFHNLYGTRNNTPEQLEEYINIRRKELGITVPFTIQSYLDGNVLKPGDLVSNVIKFSA